MKKKAFIWRKSICTNEFRCNKCGTVLADKDGVIDAKNVVFAQEFAPFVLCGTCSNNVAKVQMVDVPEGMQGKQGDFEDFLKGAAQ